MNTRSQLLGAAFSAALLTALPAAHADDEVIVPANTQQQTSYSTRNDAITLREGAGVTGSLDTRNGAITLLDGATAGAIDSRNGDISLARQAAAGGISTRNGQITLGPQASAGNIESRNGAVELQLAARAESIETRNGEIRLGTDSVVDGQLTTRNGQISAGPGARISAHIESRNGEITMANGVFVGGDITSRNGAISLTGTEVVGSLQSAGGTITLEATTVGGDVRIIVEPPENNSWFGMGGEWSSPDAGDILLTGNSTVSGDIILSLPTEYDNDLPKVVIETGSRVLGKVSVDKRAGLSIEGAVAGDVERSEPGA